MTSISIICFAPIVLVACDWSGYPEMLKIFWVKAEGREKNRRPKKISPVMLSRVTTVANLYCRQPIMQVTRIGLNSHDRLVVGRLCEREQGFISHTYMHTHTMETRNMFLSQWVHFIVFIQTKINKSIHIAHL